jgi:hypothetical protein
MTRPVGIVVAAITAAVVFGGGQAIVSSLKGAARPPAEVPTPPPPPPAPPPAPVVAAPPDGATDGGGTDVAVDGGAAVPAQPAATTTAETTTTTADAATTGTSPGVSTSSTTPGATTATAAAAPPPEPEPAATPSEDHAKTETTSAERRGSDHDKEAAREAWRKNYPDVSADDAHATVLIPIKGSTDGAAYHLTKKPRSVVVNLPKAESLITMRVYPIKHDGLRSLWIKQDPSEGATLRLTMVPGTSPQVEIKDEYVRITMRKPSPDSN